MLSFSLIFWKKMEEMKNGLAYKILAYRKCVKRKSK